MWYDLFDGKLSDGDIRRSGPYVGLFTFGNAARNLNSVSLEGKFD